MKANSFLLSIFGMCFLLVGCKPNQNDIKITFDYVENGKIVTISGQQLYSQTILKSQSLAVLFGVDNCASCSSAYDKLDAYSKTMHCNTYYINMTKISENDYQYIVDATSYANEAYAFPSYGETLNLPIMYLFSHQGVILTANDLFVDYLTKYCQVE